MPRRGAKRPRKRGSMSSRSSSDFPATALRYRGPIWDPGAIGNRDIVTANLLFEGTLTSSAGGVISSVYDQSMTGLQGWTQFSQLYDEFRVLGCQLEYFPANRYSRGAIATFPGFGVIDRDSNGALTSTAQAVGYASCRILSLDDPWTDRREFRGSSVPSLSYRMDAVNDGLFITTAAPTPATKPTIKLYITGLTATTNYGIVIQRVLVQFRGKAL